MKKYFKILFTFHSLLFAFFCSAQYNVLYVFSGNDGFPSDGLTLSGNVLYGMDEGVYTGPNNGGQVFSVHTDGTDFKDLLVFNGTNGGYPGGDLTLSGNMLYGMTSGGNYLGYDGDVFCIDTNGNNYKELLRFNGPNGEEPSGDVTIAGNVLYGTTDFGGAHNGGLVFSIHTDGTGYKDLIDFNGTNGVGGGSFTLIGKVLYAMTAYGGAYGGGVIFSIDTDGTGYRDLFDFSGGSNGASPRGNLTLCGNKFYGMTVQGGVAGYGNIFSIDTNGNGYKDLFEFNGTDGEMPFGSLLYVSGRLFGTAQHGGAYGGGQYGSGVIFCIDTSGNNYKDLFDFHGKYGSQPGGVLTLSGNIFYGNTFDSGTDYQGVIFSFKDTSGALGIYNLTKSYGGVKVYPNPSNGGFTLAYQLQPGQTGEFIMYDMLGKKIANYPLNPNEEKMSINEASLDNGVYLYSIIVNNSIVKQDKLVIIK